MLDKNTPIIIGVGQITEKEDDLEKLSSPIDLIEQATRRAAKDAGLDVAELTNLDELVIVRGFREPTRNSPEALAKRIGASKAKQWLTPNGGNAPQYLVNRYFESIFQGKQQLVLIAGAEAMDNSRRFHKDGIKNDWSEKSDFDPNYLYPDREMTSDHEKSQGIWPPAHVYPMFENALRKSYGNTIEQHQQVLGELFSDFSKVAAKSEHAWYPIERSAAEISTATKENRYVGWPYTKFMNAMNQINQSAAILMTSVGHAIEMGVPEEKWVFLHGCADTNEKWHVTERVNYSNSPAIRVLGEQVFRMANMSVNDMDFIDIYSCFPSAVQIARDELGIAKDDKRELTITGGLPFHGGAGNNYVMNSIAAMVDKLRVNPGKFGFVTANGGYLTKHSAGIYSTAPTTGPWQRAAPDSYQHQIDDLPHPPYVECPDGAAIIETYTVAFGRDNTPEEGIIIGRLGDGSDPLAPRFVAHTPKDMDLLVAMTKNCFIGKSGVVTSKDGINTFLSSQ